MEFCQLITWLLNEGESVDHNDNMKTPIQHRPIADNGNDILPFLVKTQTRKILLILVICKL